MKKEPETLKEAVSGMKQTDDTEDALEADLEKLRKKYNLRIMMTLLETEDRTGRILLPVGDKLNPKYNRETEIQLMDIHRMMKSEMRDVERALSH
jgi:hypothetical protein